MEPLSDSTKRAKNMIDQVLDRGPREKINNILLKGHSN